MLCELDPTLRPRAESCKLLPWTTDARIRKPHPNPYNRASPGFEDPRGFVWGGAPLLSGTVQLVNTRRVGWALKLAVSQQGAGKCAGVSARSAS